MNEHVVIVGSGVIGLACAWRLAPHAQVTLLERATPGAGATLASLGALWPSRPTFKGPLQTLQRDSLWSFESFIHELQTAAGLPVPFHRYGHLELLPDAKARQQAIDDVAAAAADWPRFGHPQPLSYLEAADVRARFPQVRPTDFGALLSHVTAQVDVPALVAALTQACTRAGVTIRPHTPVQTLRFHQDRCTAVVTDSGDIPGDIFLLTAGAWTHLLHPRVAASVPTRPSKGQAIEIALPDNAPLAGDNPPHAAVPPPAPPMPAVPPMPLMIVRHQKTYVVPWGNRALVGSTTEPEAGFDTSAPAHTADALLARAQAFLPNLAHARITRTWSGLRPDVRKHQPIMGPLPGTENIIICTGHFKTGIGLAPKVAQQITTLLTASWDPQTPNNNPNQPARSQ